MKPHSKTPIDLILIKQLLKHPPHTLHKTRIQRFVIILEIDPTPHSRHGCLPFLGITHHDGSTFGIVLVDAHGFYVIGGLDIQLFIDFVLDRQAVAIPTKAAFDMESIQGGVTTSSATLKCNKVTV